MRKILLSLLLLPCAVSLTTARTQAAEPVCFEAERASLLEAPMTRVEPAADDKPEGAIAGASGGAYLVIPEGSGNPPKVTKGLATFAFTVPEEGQYHLWCRVWWPDECGNSFSMQLDDGPVFTFGQDSTVKTWHWVAAPARLKQLQLAAGRHTLTIMNREDGAAVDQVLLTKNRRYVPVEVEKVTAEPETVTP
jgi:hypothetical protein